MIEGVQHKNNGEVTHGNQPPSELASPAKQQVRASIDTEPTQPGSVYERNGDAMRNSERRTVLATNKDEEEDEDNLFVEDDDDQEDLSDYDEEAYLQGEELLK